MYNSVFAIILGLIAGALCFKGGSNLYHAIVISMLAATALTILWDIKDAVTKK